jgi:hypothetical protein
MLCQLVRINQIFITILAEDILELLGPMTTTPSAFSGSCTIATGGVAQQLAAAAEVVNGGVIKNPLSATEQGISIAESLFVNFVTSAGPGPWRHHD